MQPKSNPRLAVADAVAIPMIATDPAVGATTAVAHHRPQRVLCCASKSRTPALHPTE